MPSRSLSFEAIDPHIRLVHLFEVPGTDPLPPRAAYDYRIMYIYGGQGKLVIDGTEYEATKGKLFFWQPGTVYALVPDRSEKLVIFGINFDFTQAGSAINYPIPPDPSELFNADNRMATIDFTDLPALNATLVLNNMQSLETNLLDMEKEYTLHKKFYLAKIRGLFLMLVGDIARHATSTYTEQDELVHKVDLILQYIRDHYDEPLTNRQIGEHFNFHPVYINRLLVRYTGTPLHQYLIQCRIARALNLMQHSGRSITEAALESGFQDVNYFSKCFKKRLGISPKHYLEAARRQGTR